MKPSDVRASFDRCETAGDFAEKFYEVFLNSSPELAPLFAKRVGHSHARAKLNIRPELYDLWLDSLCETAKAMDAKWTPELERSWRECMAPGIALITSLY